MRVGGSTSSSVSHTVCLDQVRDTIGVSGSSYAVFGGGMATAFGFVEQTPCRYCVMCPLIVSTNWGQYLDELEYVSPGHVSKFPALIYFSQVDLVGNPATA